MQRFVAELRNFENSKLWGLHFVIPEPVLEAMLVEAPDKRVICTFDDKEKLHCPMMPSGTFHFIMINQTFMKKCKYSLGQKVQLQLEPDTSVYGMEMPEELEEFLIQDELGAQYFEALTPGKKRNLIYAVANVKSTDKRIEKSQIILTHLKKQKGKLDFRILIDDFKKGI